MSRKMILIFVTTIILLSSFITLAPGEPPPPPPATCTPGFWKQPHHFQYWEIDDDPGDPYDSSMTLLQALQGGYATRQSRFIVAGWLNEANPDAPCH